MVPKVPFNVSWSVLECCVACRESLQWKPVCTKCYSGRQIGPIHCALHMCVTRRRASWVVNVRRSVNWCSTTSRNCCKPLRRWQ